MILLTGTHFASRTRAMVAATVGVAALVPSNVSSHSSYVVIVACGHCILSQLTLSLFNVGLTA